MAQLRLPSELLALGASARLTRAVVTDDVGQWWVKDRADRAMDRYAASHAVEPWWWKYRSGLDCPFCVGFWITLGVFIFTAVVKGSRAEPAWRVLMSALTANYVAAHVGARLGDTSEAAE